MNEEPTKISTNMCRGFTWLGTLLLIPFGLLVLVILAFGYYEIRKAYWDSKVAEMCEKDGGGKVLQTMVIRKEEYARLRNKFGKFEIPMDGSDAEGSSIIQRQTSTYIRRNDPEIRQDKTVVVRKSDNAVLAESIIYSRVGGDLIALQPSYFSCPKAPIDIYSAAVRQEG